MRARSEQQGDRRSERRTGRINFGGRLARVDLERQVEAACAGKQREQVVEHREAGCDVALARSGQEAGTAHRSARSMSAPSARSRSSIRS